MKKEINTTKSKKIVIISSLMVIIAGILFLSFSYFTPSITEENNYTTSGGANARTPDITYSDLSSGINLSGTYPMTDTEGLTQNPYTFNIRNNESESIIYEIYLQTETGNTIADNLVSASLDDSNPKVLNTFPTDNPSSGYSHSYKIKSGELAANADKDFDLKVWLNESGTIETVQNKNWYGKIFVKARFGLLGASTIKNLVAGEPTNTTDVITKTAPQGATCTNTLAYDGTTDNNLRYVGADPCNYVTFNGETAGWRIVGIMNNVDDGTGNLETRIKLIRNDSLGNYSWDSSESSVNSGWGVNDWSQADLMQELNDDYLNTSLTANTNWYNGRFNAQTGVFDYTKRLSASAQDLIDNAKWYLGGFKYSSSDYSSLIPSTMYTKERGTTVWGSTSGQTCKDGACPRATEWTGKVALIYPSDYGYATAGGNTTNRTSCIGTVTTYSWNNSSYSDCKNNDWLKPSSGYNWLLAPGSNSAYHAFYVDLPGYVNYISTHSTRAVLPAVYLSSGVTISGGNGSQEKPYIIE